MPTEREMVDAAKKAPSARSTAEQSLVDAGLKAGMLSVKNANHEAERVARYGR